MRAPAQNAGDAREVSNRGDELYPGLVVHDHRVCGSITVGQSRLPVWAVPMDCWLEENWDYAKADYGVSDEHLSEFVHDLLEARRDLGRLLLVIADCERREGKNGRAYGGKRAKNRLLNALNEAYKYVEGDGA